MVSCSEINVVYYPVCVLKIVVIGDFHKYGGGSGSPKLCKGGVWYDGYKIGIRIYISFKFSAIRFAAL